MYPDKAEPRLSIAKQRIEIATSELQPTNVRLIKAIPGPHRPINVKSFLVDCLDKVSLLINQSANSPIGIEASQLSKNGRADTIPF